MTIQEEIMVDQLSRPIGILEYNLKLKDDDITDLVQDYDFEYDSYFNNKKEEISSEV